jgi:NAD(P)-dependent dehydrogenase (short-subunit alcohol dehydrogenase family)
MRGLDGRCVVAAGAGTGIGAAAAERLAAEGARVVVGDIDADLAGAVRDRIREKGGTAVAVEFDIVDEESVRRLYAKAIDEFGSVGGTHVNVAELRAAFIGRDVDAANLPDDVFDRTMHVNVLGHVYCTRYAVPLIEAAGGGGIVYTSSGAAEMGDPVNPAYAMSKAGVQALARHVASRWGKVGVRANAVAPGMVLSGHPRELSDDFLHARDAVLTTTRSPRLGRPEDVAAAVAFLLSDDAEWINGQVIGVDGGLLLR